MTLRLGVGLGLIPTAARPVATTAPVNVVAPSMPTPLTQGQTSSINPGSWSGLPSGLYQYQKQRWNGSAWVNAGSSSSSASVTYDSADVAAGANGVRAAVTATNDAGSTTAYTDPVTIAPPLSISGTPSGGTVGTSYSFTPTVAGGHTPRSFALLGTLPSGLMFNTATGAIAGIPSSSGTASGLNITVTDADGLTASLGTFSITVAAAPAGPATFTMTQLAAANRVYPRITKTGGGQGKGQGTIPVTINATVTGTIYARCRSAADGTTILQASWLAAALSATGSQVVNIAGVDARLGWFYLDLSGDGSTWISGTVAVGMGVLTAMAGQSLMIRHIRRYEGTETNASLGVTINPNSAVYATLGENAITNVGTPVWTVPADGSNYNSTGCARFPNLMVGLTGVNCGIVAHGWGQTAISEWITGGSQVTAMRARFSEAPNFENLVFFQGHSDAQGGLTDYATYKSRLAQLMADIATYSTHSLNILILTIPNINSGAWGNTLQRQRIRKAAYDWVQENTATFPNAQYLQPVDLNLADGVHPAQPGQIQVAEAFYRGLRPKYGATGGYTGPTIVSASRTGRDITLTLAASPNATGYVTAGSPHLRFAVYWGQNFAGPLGMDFPYTLDGTTPFAIAGNVITLKLASDPGDQVPLSVFYGLPSSDAANDGGVNGIWDNSNDGDGCARGRQMLANVIEVPVPAVTATRDLTMSGPPTYGTGKFSQGLIFGTGTALGARTPLPPFTLEGWIKKAANPGAIQVFFGEAGAGWLGVNTDGRLLAVYNYTDTNAVYLTATSLNSPTGNTLPVITDNAWHHISLTVTPTGGYVHVDGVYLGSNSQTPRTLRTRTANPAVRKLGGGSNTLSANDVVDDVAIYNYAARPPSDFTPPSAAHTSGETGLAMLWPLENSGANIAA